MCVKPPERFQLCYYADAYYGSHPTWSNGNEALTVVVVPHKLDSRFVLTLEISTSISGPKEEVKFCLQDEKDKTEDENEDGAEDETKDGAAVTGYIDVAFVLTERAPLAPAVPGGPVEEVTTLAVYSQQVTHCHYETKYDDMMLSLRDDDDDEPEVNAVVVLFGDGKKKPSAADEAAVVARIRSKLSASVYQAVGMPDEVVGSTCVDEIEQDLSACFMLLTYEMYLEAINGAIERLRELCQKYENKQNKTVRYYQRNRFARG
ncbi:hypothetical protein PG988_006149 [Apiospora saccharicola]